MEDDPEQGITAAALHQMAETADPRLRRVMEGAVRHLHDWAREVSLTPEEWLFGIRFLTAVGQNCTEARQEFILLSDVLGLSSVVNALHDDGVREAATESSLLGPFFREGAPALELGDSIARHDAADLAVFGRVLDAEGNPVPHAALQVWQTGAEGLYDLQHRDLADMDLRGCFRADAEGRYHFRTVRPLGYAIPMDGPVGALVHAQGRHGMRPAHIHFLVGAPGYRELVTALYLADDPHIGSDTVFGVSDALVVRPEAGLAESLHPGLPALRYDFRLARAAEGEKGGRVGADPSRLLAPVS